VAELAWVIKNAKMFVGIDSFPMHVAQSMSVPGVCFFGSILPETRLLKNSSIKSVVAEGIKCLGCHHRKSTPCTATTSCEIGIQDCVNNVTVDHMWRAIEKLAIHKDK
jgi:ADP-heptose:LPS heptosyltransferase